jgi:hypothetical protein
MAERCAVVIRGVSIPFSVLLTSNMALGSGGVPSAATLTGVSRLEVFCANIGKEAIQQKANMKVFIFFNELIFK